MSVLGRISNDSPVPSNCTSSSKGCRQRGMPPAGVAPGAWPSARGCGMGGNAQVWRRAADSGCTARMLSGSRSSAEALMDRSCFPSLVTASFICLEGHMHFASVHARAKLLVQPPTSLQKHTVVLPTIQNLFSSSKKILTQYTMRFVDDKRRAALLPIYLRALARSSGAVPFWTMAASSSPAWPATLTLSPMCRGSAYSSTMSGMRCCSASPHCQCTTSAIRPSCR